jgi:hypothetical protein
MSRKIFPFIIITIWISTTIICFAADYIPLETIPAFGDANAGTGLSGYLETVFAFGISIAGIMAVAMIVIGGIQYITAYGNPGMVGNAKNRITQALLGLLLVVGAWLILYTINPDLAKGKLTVPSVPDSKQYYGYTP